MSDKAKSVLKIYYLYGFLTAVTMSSTFVTYVVFLKRHGMDEFDRNVINSCFMLAILLFEMPTGVIADVFGRKISLIIAHIFFGTGALVYYMSNQMWTFILAEVMIAIGFTCGSGALDAWIIDSMDYYESSYSRQNVYSVSGMLKNFGYVLGGVIGGFVGNLDKFAATPWVIFSFGNYALTVYIWVAITEPYFVRKYTGILESYNRMKEVFRVSVQSCNQSYNMKLFMIANAAVIAGVQTVNMLWSVKYEAMIGLQNTAFYIWVPMAVFMIVGGYIGKITSKSTKKAYMLGIAVVFLSTCIMFAANDYLVLSVVMLCLHQISRGFYGPVHGSLIDDELDIVVSQNGFSIKSSEIRATVKSIDSMTKSLGAAIGLLVMGKIAKSTTINFSWQMASLWLVLVVVVFMFFFKRKNK